MLLFYERSSLTLFTLQNLFFTYPSHNFLHTLIQDMIVTTLATPASISGELTAVVCTTG